MGDAETRMPDGYDEEMDAIYAHEVDVWIDEHEKVNGKVPQKSNTRIIICENLATMSNYRLLGGDNPHGLAAGMASITPPATHTWGSKRRPAWGSQGKPNDFWRQMMRLDVAGLAEYILEEQVEDQPGRIISGIVLTPAGIIYAYRHGRLTWSDVEDYWAYSQGWRQHPTTNIWHTGGAPHVEDDSQFKTKSFNSTYIHTLQRDDDLRKRYSAWSGDRIGRLVAASWAADPGAVYRLLEKDEREAVVKDLLKRMNVPEWLIDQQATDTLKAGTIPQIIERLITTYEDAKPLTMNVSRQDIKEELGDPPALRKGESLEEAQVRVSEAVHEWRTRDDAERTVAEMFGRVGWIIAQSVMEYRVNDNSAQVLGRFGHDRTDATPTPKWGDSVETLKQLTEQVEAARKQLEAVVKPAIDAQDFRLSVKRRAFKPKPRTN
jgi:hypothetical protein